ncbi:MarR family winged helix-turn-helix transcriptional regulator [Streptomyces sp. RPT161]|uniref:MarR family winged helix-turn-helix transcriptional regulator n=1 Tax=Streptomyces sp. RPT161 TaxID=3015993 RepID=UPI0022B8BCDF|nr:MarR family winged helix-turn-helix transcriptional regulator [Streptomyces sp. RPT161]
MEETPEESCRETAAALFDVTTVMIRHLSDRQGMSLTTASTLRRLEQAGPIRLTALAAAEGVTQPSMTQLVQRLERQGLATRVGDPQDGRVCLVAITDAGREVLAERHRSAHARLAELLGTLPAEDLQALGEAMRTALPVIHRMTQATARPRVPGGGPAH